MLAQQQKGINWSLNKFNPEIKRFLSITALRPWNSFATGAVGAEKHSRTDVQSSIPGAPTLYVHIRLPVRLPDQQIVSP